MTIREHFQRFHKRLTYITVSAVVLAVVLIELRYPHLTRLQNLMVALILGVVTSIVLLLGLKGRFRCPRCGADFQKLRRAQQSRLSLDARMYWDVWDACPNCAVSFDAPYSGDPN